MDLREVLAALEGLPQKEREAVVSEALEATKGMLFVPNPGPQMMAFHSDADELFYGGQAGGGKSALVCGLAATEHTRSLILRRQRDDAKDMAEAELLGNLFDGDRSGWNGSDLIWRGGEQLIKFGGCQMEEDKQNFKGKPYDLMAFDEVTDFLESQYIFITIWNRSAKPGQRSRIVATGNPPTSATGLWVIRRWAAWLDPRHPNPAKPGELRWYLRNEHDEDTEVDGPGPHLVGGEEVYAKSRTFIPAKLSDNPDLADDGEYKRTLDALPKELRDAYRDGKFSASLRDEANQTIPTSWVTAAMARWKSVPPIGIPMCAIGVDVAQGGADKTVLAWRHDGWYAPLVAVPGSETPGGTDVAGLVISKRRDGCKVVIDIGGGWGGDAYAHLKVNGVDAVSYMGVKPSTRRTDDNLLKFFNTRTEAYWRFREALNPDQPGGSTIMLPDDQELLSDLTAPTYEIKRANSGGVIQLEPKDALVKRLGRSPDKGDAVVMAWHAGAKAITDARIWGQQHKGRAAPRVIMRKK